MDTTFVNENRLNREIDQLREQFPHTQELYREVCVLLFFRYGVTPTANKLYQLVRKGSMTAPAEALSKFWEVLREKSRVRIEHPDLPEVLKTSSGELIATLWTTAQAKAHEALAVYQNEALAKVAEAQAACAVLVAERDESRRALDAAQHTLTEFSARLATGEKKLAAAHATIASLETQLKQEKIAYATQQQSLEDARRDFSSELDKLRAALQLAEERCHATEKRSLLEIDRERSAIAKLQKMLEANRSASLQAVDKARAETVELQDLVGDLRQKIGMLEGNLQAIVANRDMLTNELKFSQSQAAQSIAQANLLLAEVENWRHLAGAQQKTRDVQRKRIKLKRLRRTPNAE